MKNNIFSYVALMLAVTLCACSDDDERVKPDANLPVNYASIAGIWQLATWNGAEMNDECYLYMIIDRKADDQSGRRAFQTYQNIDSSKSRHLTSTYELTDDEDRGVIISGMYDHSAGFWNSEYFITDLSGDTMTWTVTDDDSDRSVYIRCEAIPEDILNGTRALE